MKLALNSFTFLTCMSLLCTTQVKAQWPTTGTHIYNSNTGNVGINNGALFTPTEKLQIKNGNVLLDYWAGSPGVNGTGNLYFGGVTNGSPAQNGMRLSFASGGNGYIDARTSTALTGLVFRVDNNNGGTERLRINANGFVGIANANPWCRLHLNGDLFVTGAGRDGNPVSSSIFLGDDATPQYAVEYDGTSGGLNFWKPFGSTNGSGGEGFGNFFLFLKNNGKVGIHTNNPTADFTVNGNVLIGDASVALPAGYKLYVQTGILTEKVKVAIASSANWADYVFEANYPLKNLNELEIYIKKNKHLPNIPSAAEVVENGIDVATINAKLLEKIEELSLYIIEQNKRLEALEKKNGIK